MVEARNTADEVKAVKEQIELAKQALAEQAALLTEKEAKLV